ncbi:MAG TPA: MBL fold metallo-hydrolase [Candidatus Eisenbacteria bacterium]|jgi:glyoxylase-like metal-dependent hydrolase (beta-lactamase superfamily II)|nr:MBL fold metallo-hydrolase [Candidatus Eisenbacteria bacterium]
MSADKSSAAPTAIPSVTIGPYTVRFISGGRFRLDGGAMFGVVPKTLWNRVAPADERNRIQMGMNCLLIEGNGKRVLVDAGSGTKIDAKFRDIYAIEKPEGLIYELAAAGAEPDQIDTVALTHLHFDHCGGGTTRGEDGVVRPTFPKAHYLIRRQEWDDAHHANERNRASYLSENYDPLAESGQLILHKDDMEILPGVWMKVLPGHTLGHQGVFFDVPGQRALYTVDLVPTVAHLPLPFIMGYDLYPMMTLETKRAILRDATREKWLLLLEHDPEHLAIRVSGDPQRVTFEKVA